MTTAKHKAPRKGGRAPTRAERRASGAVCVEVWLDPKEQATLARVAKAGGPATRAAALREGIAWLSDRWT